MKNKNIIIILAAIVLLGGLYYWTAGRTANSPEDTGGSTPEEGFCTMDAKLCPDGSYVGRVAPSCEFAPCPAPKPLPEKPVFEDGTAPDPTESVNARVEGGVALQGDMIEEIYVIYSDKGFAPQSVTINKGQTVKFVNNSSRGLWVASAPHPTHTDYPGFDSKVAVAKGQTYSFAFDRTGSWAYHNHEDPEDAGTVIVK